MTQDDIRHLRNRLDHIEDPAQLAAIAHSLLDELERMHEGVPSGTTVRD